MSAVYSTPVEIMEDSKNRVIAGCNTIRNGPSGKGSIGSVVNKEIIFLLPTRGSNYLTVLVVYEN